MISEQLSTTLAQEINAHSSQVVAAIQLLDAGDTVPFIARYRKEATNGLNDTQLRLLADRLHYLRELQDRKALVLKTIKEQDKLTPELEQAILAANTKTRLEDLYLPFRPQRRTKASIARLAGLEPLSVALLEDPTLDLTVISTPFINPDQGIETIEQALDGARQILIERFSEDANLLDELRSYFWEHGILKTTAAKNKKPQASKFADYFNYEQPIKKIPSHRALALFRGRRESFLQFELRIDNQSDYGQQRILSYFNINHPNQWLLETVRLAWSTKLVGKLELESLTRLRELADTEAILVFTKNLRDLLLASPAGARVTMGLDPGIRTGVKVAVINSSGTLLDYTTVFPLAPNNEWHEAIACLAKLIAKYNVELISIGNGTGSRETERLITDLIKMYPDMSVSKILVNEAGASVYSASAVAAAEFPDLDVTLRGAVSIARRLQDPLAELVKIEPKSIGVGQYQHDVNQPRLARSLEGVVEDCVNCVGVDINLASAALLTHVSGLNETLANNLVQYRNEHGAFSNREQLKLVPRMGEKSFQQAAGFLRIFNGNNPLDASTVHPESYTLVERILNDNQITIQDAIGNESLLKTIKPSQYVTEQYGLPTICDVLKELEKPGRDPRPSFKTVQFKEGVENITQLQVGMILDGVVSNVTNFGAFVDIGVHQDGLVHISAMTNRFITDPSAIVKTGQMVTVKVIEVDTARRRIGLSMKLDDAKPITKALPTTPIKNKKVVTPKTAVTKKAPEKKPVTTLFNTSMADALSKLKRRED